MIDVRTNEKMDLTSTLEGFCFVQGCPQGTNSVELRISFGMSKRFIIAMQNKHFVSTELIGNLKQLGLSRFCEQYAAGFTDDLQQVK